jgi:hypothetical protein
MELFAWLAELSIYQLNRIPASHRLKFLALAGIQPEPPMPARTVLSFFPKSNVDQIHLPASAEFEGKDALGETTRFLTQYPITIVAAELATIQVFDGAIFREMKRDEEQWRDIPVFGSVPEPGASIYFGFYKDLSTYDGAASIYIQIAGLRKNWTERLRMTEEAEMRKSTNCRDLKSMCGQHTQNGSKQLSKNNGSQASRLEHHSVRTTWEFHPEGAGEDEWESLCQENGEVFDDTRSFTLDGRLILKIPMSMQAEPLGKIAEPKYYVRCRFQSGAYDAPPVIKMVVMNALPAEQAVPVGHWKLSIAADATISGTPPKRGDTTRIQVSLDQNEIVQSISFLPDDRYLPLLNLLDYQPPDPLKDEDGHIYLELDALGKSDGGPLQMPALDQKSAIRQSFKLLTLEKQDQTKSGIQTYLWHEWELRNDLDASGRNDLHYTLEPTEGSVRFGDGEQGRIPPNNSMILADYRATRANAGNLSADVVHQLVDSLHNHWMLENFADVKTKIKLITNPLPAEGGAEAETLIHAEGRALEVIEKTQRAITLKDIEKLALETPGTEIARVSVWPNLCANLPCLKATGVVSIVVLPNMPVPKPEPSLGLLCAVRSYLNRHRIIGMRINVVGPSYKEVKIEAQVKACDGINKADLRLLINEHLNSFLDPIKGGPDQNGWPFGRDVYRTEILQLIDEVEGVDRVESLSLIANGNEPQCGNIPLCPTELVTPGTHNITVM